MMGFYGVNRGREFEALVLVGRRRQEAAGGRGCNVMERGEGV